MLGLDNYAEDFRTLLGEIKKYLELEKQYMMLTAAEKTIILLSALITAEICLLFGSMILLFLLIALAFWIGEVTGSMAIGFLSTSGILLLLLAIVYGKRRTWIIQPVARLVVKTFAVEERKEAEDE